jgi:hypothetical protein
MVTSNVANVSMTRSQSCSGLVKARSDSLKRSQSYLNLVEDLSEISPNYLTELLIKMEDILTTNAAVDNDQLAYYLGDLCITCQTPTKASLIITSVTDKIKALNNTNISEQKLSVWINPRNQDKKLTRN